MKIISEIFLPLEEIIERNVQEKALLHICYSIVKDSSADLGFNSKIVQIRPRVKAVSTKISKKIFGIFVNIMIFLRENKEPSFFLNILNILAKTVLS